MKWKIPNHFFLLLMLLTVSVFLLKKEKKRRWSLKPINRKRKEKGMFTNLIKTMILEDHEGFFSYTRMTPKLIEILLSKVGQKLQKNPSKNPIPPVHRLLITLHYLSEGCSMKEIACGHYLGHSTVSAIIRETTQTLWEVLAPSVLKVPSVEEWETIAKGYYKRWNLPNCIGAVDGKHVNIQAPKHSGFTLVDIGAAGGNHDSVVFSSSGFGNAILAKKLNIPARKKLPNTEIEFPHYFAADAAFPLHENIMRPYPGQNLTVDRRICNYRISRGRRTIEHSFGILANRWRILRRPLICDLGTCENIVQACVVLHNFVQRSELEIPQNERRYCPTGFATNSNFDLRNNNLRSVGRVGSNNPKKQYMELRNILCMYLNSPQGSVPWQLEQVQQGCVPEGPMEINIVDDVTTNM